MFTVRVDSVDRYVGRLSVQTRPIYRPRVGRHLVDSWAMVGRGSVDI